jgi:hypothetical protein
MTSVYAQVYYHVANDHSWRSLVILQNISFNELVARLSQKTGLSEELINLWYTYSISISDEPCSVDVFDDYDVEEMLFSGDVNLVHHTVQQEAVEMDVEQSIEVSVLSNIRLSQAVNDVDEPNMQLYQIINDNNVVQGENMQLPEPIKNIDVGPADNEELLRTIEGIHQQRITREDV